MCLYLPRIQSLEPLIREMGRFFLDRFKSKTTELMHANDYLAMTSGSLIDKRGTERRRHCVRSQLHLFRVCLRVSLYFSVFFSSV